MIVKVKPRTPLEISIAILRLSINKQQCVPFAFLRYDNKKCIDKMVKILRNNTSQEEIDRRYPVHLRCVEDNEELFFWDACTITRKFLDGELPLDDLIIPEFNH